NETYFQIPSAIEAKFRAAAKRTANPGADDESGITIEVSPEAPKAPRTEGGRDRPTGNRSHHARGDNPGPRDGRPPFKRKGPPRRR
ncbi:hypothetical protein, partial [Enterococcus faecalis]|uniref:hypothetical protein n=1 Tax=Enterococcus faecalis TaxID=1351 RepID=UPI00403F1977